MSNDPSRQPADSRASDLRECDDVIGELKAALHRVVDDRWEGQRRDFRIHKRLAARLLRELGRDVRSMRVRSRRS